MPGDRDWKIEGKDNDKNTAHGSTNDSNIDINAFDGKFTRGNWRQLLWAHVRRWNGLFRDRNDGAFFG